MENWEVGEKDLLLFFFFNLTKVYLVFDIIVRFKISLYVVQRITINKYLQYIF